MAAEAPAAAAEPVEDHPPDSGGNELAVRQPQDMSGWQPSSDQIELVKRQLMPGASDDELQLFVGVAQRTGLDPFARQIYAVKRRERMQDGSWGDRWSFQVGIDGFRLIAQRTGQYAGQQGPWWCGSDGNWREVWDHVDSGPPTAARVGVLRAGFAEPLYRVAVFNEYVQKTSNGSPTAMWRNMPANQLAKCAEALALRSAFPAELSGLYTDDEMAQATTPPDEQGYTGASGPQHQPVQQQPPAKAADKANEAGRPAAGGAGGDGLWLPEPGYEARFPSVRDALAWLERQDKAYPWPQLMAQATELLLGTKVATFGDLEPLQKREVWLRMCRVCDWIVEHCGDFPPPAREDVLEAFRYGWEGIVLELPEGVGDSRADRLANIAAGGTKPPAATPEEQALEGTYEQPAEVRAAEVPTGVDNAVDAVPAPSQADYDMARQFLADPAAFGGGEPDAGMLESARKIVAAYEAVHGAPAPEGGQQ